FELQPGEMLGLIGPSGAGKSTLARHLVGVLPRGAGTVRLDGADVRSWPFGELGQYVGFLPQEIELFPDTVAANINRFQPGNDEATIEAARLADVHELILALPQGYNTQISEGGVNLSGGIRQRIGLARAVYGNPSLVVLDEPSSNLDSNGDAALDACLQLLKRRGATVVVVSHRPATIGLADKLLILNDGAVVQFGPRAEVLERLRQRERFQTVRSA
ncbi:MAG: ATP-binding cassette domain-containing protein, partial [Alphaproteobacteria bacterium]|nr:ATP-binding cassette domain-containing protein [Alphaproteobacteria bacterium]